jgi:ParB family chromosome partitioning protein
MAPKRPSLRARLERDTLFHTSADLPRLVELDVDAIGANPDQPRQSIDPAGLAELVTSIGRQGLLQPILVRRAGEQWVLVAGQRRLAAVRQLGRPTIAAIVTEGNPLEVALVENLQREALGPFDEAAAIRRLMERHRWTQAEVGEALGRKQSSISAILALERLPERIRDEYPMSDRVGRSLLIELAQMGDADAQMQMWESVKAGGVTVRDVRHGRKTEAGARSTRPAEPADLDLRRLAAGSERLLDGLRRLDARRLQGGGDLLERLSILHQALGRLLESVEGGTRPRGRARG